MKFEGFISSDEIRKAGFGNADMEAQALVKGFMPEFVANPTKVGPVLNIKEDKDDPWCSKEVYDNMPYRAGNKADSKSKLGFLIRYRLKRLFFHIDLWLDSNKKQQFKWKFEPAWEYMGDGKVALYWTRRKKKQVRGPRKPRVSPLGQATGGQDA